MKKIDFWTKKFGLADSVSRLIVKRTGALVMALIFCLFIQYPGLCNSQVQEKQQETRAKINNLKWLETQETNKLYKNQLKLERAEKDLLYSKRRFDNSKDKLETLETDLQNSLRDFSKLEVHAKKRINQIYKTQRKGLFRFLISSTDFNDFLDRIYYQNLITKKDKGTLIATKTRAKKIASLKYQMEQERKMLAYSIKNINSQQETIQKAIGKNENYIQKLRTDRMAYERAEKELARQSANIQNMISRSSGGADIKIASNFMKPIAGSITSPFGWRIHPIFKSRTFHSGVDIGGVYLSPIKASNSGKVIYSGWYGGYGKVVIVDHGHFNSRPTTTLYAHMDRCHVEVGDYVVKGQSLGAEGTTGYSTGPHLHFEVRTDGQPQNPLNYI